MEKNLLSDILENVGVGGKAISISLHDITLTYDKNKCKENSDNYIEEQLEAHKKSMDYAKEELLGISKELNSILEKEGDLERIMRFTPENTIRPVIGLAKLIVAPSSWIKLKTLNTELYETIQHDELRAEGYSDIKQVINYGKEFFEDCKTKYSESLSEDKRKKLDECTQSVKELCYLYTRLTETARKIVEADKRVYVLLFQEH